MPPRKNSAGRWEQQFWTPPNDQGVKRRGYVVCPPTNNTPAFCRELVRRAIERHVRGVMTTQTTFASFARERFLVEYPAARNLRKSSRELLGYLIESVVIPAIGTMPLGAVDTACVARLVAKLQATAKPAATLKARARGPLAPTTIATAVKVLRRLHHETADHPRDTLVADVAPAYLDGCRARMTPGSFAVYRQMVALHILPNLPAGARLGDIGDRLCVQLAERLAVSTRSTLGATLPANTTTGRRYSDQTIRHVVIAVKGVLGWAEQTREIQRAPSIALPKVAEARRPKPYDRSEARALVAGARDDEERALLLAAFDLGMRKSEYLGLEWTQVHFDRHVIVVDRQRYRDQGTETTKSGREREIPMSAAMEAALKRIRRPGVKHVFADDVGHPRREHWIRSVFERARAAAQLRRVRWHDHRHTFSTLRTDAGTAPFALQQLLGHADIRTTQGYVHASADQIGSVLDDERGAS